MRTTGWLSGLAGLVLLVIAGCDKSDTSDLSGTDYTEWNSTVYLTNEVIYPKNSKLKRKIQTNRDNSYSPFEEYEYDVLGRIAKTIYPGSMYDNYEYNENGQLSGISRYDNSTLRQITSYTYDREGNRTKEEVMNTETGTISYTVLYKYQNRQLVKSEHHHKYDNDMPESRYLKKYTYNSSGEPVKEQLFSVPDDGSYVITEHFYKDGLLFYSVTYSGDDKKNGFMHDKKRIYDLNSNLVKTIGDMPALSSSFSAQYFYVIFKYEY
jgi:hypothetical protein